MGTQKFVDLLPVDNADSSGCYAEAISFALESERVKNIAITGPYGSGKSSIIKTFEKSNEGKYKFLNISLATFKDSDKTIGAGAHSEKDVDKNQQRLIERSILQQMLYGVPSEKVPFSRFRRIARPTQPYYKALLFILWLLQGGLLSKAGQDFLRFGPIVVEWWPWVIIAISFLATSTFMFGEVYKVFFRTPLKKISLKNAELETTDLPDGSILNKHLDEIVYFFQEMDFNVVVIEDLDRFGSPEIFINLREINKLVNDNRIRGRKATAGAVKFVYALRDDMFLHRDRAKFFDFIIPVVPVVNSANALDKILERIQSQSYAHHFKSERAQQFLREVSFRLDDMRLIHNIFNEFGIYFKKLHSDSLDHIKLLAMMIYKNAYPDDFEKLHYGKGGLANLCAKRSELQAQRKQLLQEERSSLRGLVTRADGERARSVQELIDAYIGHLMGYASEPVWGVVCQGNAVSFQQLRSIDSFKLLFEEQSIDLAKRNAISSGYNRRQYIIPTNKASDLSKSAFLLAT